jgi:hypothetical protein
MKRRSHAGHERKDLNLMYELNESELASVVGGCGHSSHGFKKIEVTKKKNEAQVTVTGQDNNTQIAQTNASNGGQADIYQYQYQYNGLLQVFI